MNFLFHFLRPAALAALMLLAGCGKGKSADSARADAADNPTETSSATAAEEQPAENADANTDAGSSDVPSATSAAPAEQTWVCTWCHEEYTGSRQPTSFQPGKCERNPGKAHAWHKK